ncbi:MAG: DUF1971 domain-containing protein [Acidimicrobiales bacterium]
MLRRTAGGPGPDDALQLSCGHRVVPNDPAAVEIDCEACDRRELPVSVRAGRRTPTFTAATTPPALLSAHLTRAWAELVVTRGTVRFVDEEPHWVAEAGIDRPVVIVPDRHHHIEPGPDAEFAVQFFDYPTTDQPGSAP